MANTAHVSSDEVSPAIDSNTDSVEIIARADLTVSKTAPATATAGDPAGFDYVVTVHNGGPSDHTGDLHITDVLDSGLTFAAAPAARLPARPSPAPTRRLCRSARTRRSRST